MERIKKDEVATDVFKLLMQIENYLNTSSFDMKLLELMRLRVAQIRGCAYCVDMHTKELAATGDSLLRIHALVVWKNTPYFTNKERVLLKFTEELTLGENNEISNELFTQLRTFFSKEEISILCLVVSQINSWTNLVKVCNFTPGNYEVND